MHAVFQRLSGLLNFLSGHASGCVQYKGDVLLHYHVIIRHNLWREHHHEEAVFPFHRVAQQVETEVLFGDPVVESEILVQQGLVLFKPDNGVVFVLSADAHVVRGGVDVLDRKRRLNARRDGEVFERLRGFVAGFQGIDVLVQA